MSAREGRALDDPTSLTLRQRVSRLAHVWKAITQNHHQALAATLHSWIPSDGVVLDVGAHSGQFSKLFAKLAPQGHVYAFEPSGYARSILEEVVRAHRLRNIEIIAAALGDQQSNRTLSTPLKPGGRLGFGLAHLGAAQGEARSETVPVWTLDAFVARRHVSRLDFLKADIEGFEGRMLAGAQETLARFRPALLLELDAARLARAGDTPAPIFAQLSSLGYRAHRLTPDSGLGRVGADTEPGDFLFEPAR